MIRKLLAIGAVAGLMASSMVYAAPSTLDLSGFGASDTVIDFNAIGNETAITNQYSGVDFSGALFGLTNSGDLNKFPANGDGVVASNWLYSQGSNQGLSFTAQFSSLQSRVGFNLENWANQTGTIEFFRGATSLGSISTSTAALTSEFKGFQDASGFDKIVFTNTADTNGFYAIDDFRFAAAVPEPETYALMLAGLGLVGAIASRRQKNASAA